MPGKSYQISSQMVVKNGGLTMVESKESPTQQIQTNESNDLQ